MSSLVLSSFSLWCPLKHLSGSFLLSGCYPQHSQLLAEYASLHQEYAALQAERESERQAVESLRSSSVNQDTFREMQADLERSQQRALKAEAELATLKEEHLSQVKKLAILSPR